MTDHAYVSGPAADIEQGPLPALHAQPGRDDVAGFAVIGQPFASGDVLCLRRFPVSTFGPAYVSVWHRSAAGSWTIYTSISPEQSCPRFVGAAVSRVVETRIELHWSSATDLTVSVPAAELSWHMHIESTIVTRAMNAMMSLLPGPVFRNDLMLAAMSLLSTTMLAAGRMQLLGHMPNRQWFQAGPRRVWVITAASATLGGRDLGPPGALARQPTMGEVPLPQRGIVMMGAFSFEAYAPERHLSAQPRAA